MHTVAPSHSGVKMSRSSGSWPRPDSMLNRLLSVSPKVFACHSMKCDSGRWVPTIAFGLPVEPEVYAM